MFFTGPTQKEDSMATQPKPKVNLNDFLFRTTDGSTQQVPDAATFDFAGFFDWMTDARRLLLHKSEMTWMEKQEVPGHPVDVFMNISCGTQLAPHLTLDIVG